MKTLAELSNFQQTGRTDEVERLSSELARTWPEAVNSFEYGRSGEGRPMRALVVSRTGALTAEPIRARKIPLLMLQGGIHRGRAMARTQDLLQFVRCWKGLRPQESWIGLQFCLFLHSTRTDTSARAVGIVPIGGTGTDRLANHFPEPESQSRLHQSGRARDAGHAPPDRHVGSVGLRGSARH